MPTCFHTVHDCFQSNYGRGNQVVAKRPSNQSICYLAHFRKSDIFIKYFNIYLTPDPTLD